MLCLFGVIEASDPDWIIWAEWTRLPRIVSVTGGPAYSDHVAASFRLAAHFNRIQWPTFLGIFTLLQLEEKFPDERSAQKWFEIVHWPGG